MDDRIEQMDYLVDNDLALHSLSADENLGRECDFFCIDCERQLPERYHRCQMICELCYSFIQPLRVWNCILTLGAHGPPDLRGSPVAAWHNAIGPTTRTEWSYGSSGLMEHSVITFIRITEMLRFRSDILFVWYHIRSTPEIAAMTAYFRNAPSCLQVLRADALIRQIAAFTAGGAQSPNIRLRRDIASIPELVAAIFNNDDQPSCKCRSTHRR